MKSVLPASMGPTVRTETRNALMEYADVGKLSMNVMEFVVS